MPVSDLLFAGLELMLLGMGIVFIFLVLLVFTLNGMSKISAMFAEEEHVQPHYHPVAEQKKPENTALIAVISAAVARYRAAQS
ncbi:MAG: OadG family protein [Chromatiales bacterium]|jgi:oxaloacetate decarboxylase gamma subunit